jgi:hypothetical protein
MALDGVVGEPPEEIRIPARRRILEGPDPEMAGGDADEHRSGQERVAGDLLPGREHGERPRRGDAEGVHRLADQVLAQHRPDRRLAVPAAGEGRPAGSLEVDVAAPAFAIEDLAEQERPTVAEARRVAAELMACIRHRDRRRARREGVAGQDVEAVREKSASTSRPSSAASASFATSSTGAGAAAACHGS